MRYGILWLADKWGLKKDTQTDYHIVVIKNTGHNANIDNSKEMNQVIESFLEEVADEED